MFKCKIFCFDQSQAGEFDNAQAILATLSGGYANVRVTDAATSEGLLGVGGAETEPPRQARSNHVDAPLAFDARNKLKNYINALRVAGISAVHLAHLSKSAGHPGDSAGPEKLAL